MALRLKTAVNDKLMNALIQANNSAINKPTKSVGVVINFGSHKLNLETANTNANPESGGPLGRRRKGAHPSEKSPFRKLSLKDFSKLTEKQSQKLIAEHRWGENSRKPICPKCSSIECSQPSKKAKRQLHRCRHCRKQFSLTSGTLFHAHKKELNSYLQVMYYMVCNVKGSPALAAMRLLGWSYKAAFCLEHKIREYMGWSADELELTGDVDIDGKQISGYVRPKNLASDRVDRRKAHNQSAKRLNVTTATERQTGKTVMLVTKSEAESAPYVLGMLQNSTIIHCDEGKAWGNLRKDFVVKSVNHNEGFSTGGNHNNFAESNFARIQRMIIGSFHHIGSALAQNYANECAFHETVRTTTPAQRFSSLLKRCAKRKKSEYWTGYYQHHSKNREKITITMKSILEGIFIAKYGQDEWEFATSKAQNIARSEKWQR